MQHSQNFENYKAKLDGKIREWNAEATKLQAKAQQAGADAQAKFREQADAVRRMESQAREKLTQFGNASANAGDEIKGGLDRAITDFGAAIDRAKKQFH
jgi:F0F1-type ATP synthase membrane subunit b/b'